MHKEWLHKVWDDEHITICRVKSETLVQDKFQVTLTDQKDFKTFLVQRANEPIYRFMYPKNKQTKKCNP